jgi:acyl-CoA reductase-like NAD-dependent aldehyde dehydrogenase
MTHNAPVTVARPDSTAHGLESVLPVFPPLQHYIGGAFVDSDGADTEALVDPSTGDTVADVPSGTSSDVDSAVKAAAGARRAWGRTTPADRATALLKIADLVEEHADELKALESLDTGKPLSTSDDDVVGAADCFRFSAGAEKEKKIKKKKKKKWKTKKEQIRSNNKNKNKAGNKK